MKKQDEEGEIGGGGEKEIHEDDAKMRPQEREETS